MEENIQHSPDKGSGGNVLLLILLLWLLLLDTVVCIADIGIAKTLVLPPNVSGSEPGQGEYATAEPRPGSGLTRLCRTFIARSLIFTENLFFIFNIYV